MLTSCVVDSTNDSNEKIVIAEKKREESQVKISPVRLDQTRPFRYARSFQSLGGTIYLLGLLKSKDGKRFVLHEQGDPPFGVTALTETEMNTFFARKDLFIALNYKVNRGMQGRHYAKMWRSVDNLKSLQEEKTEVIIPEAGEVDFGKPGEWAGLFFHRRILQQPDGALLSAMYGNFQGDTITPTNPRSKSETKYKLRTFVVRSTDQGKTWRFVSTVAAPRADVTDESEGFNEWTIEHLPDGRLLGVMRTGHYTPLVASWSSDGGKTWTEPMTPAGLTAAGVDPYLLKLRDGRLALAYGEIVQPQGARKDYWKRYDKQADHRRRCQLAVSLDGTGTKWITRTIADYADRSAYPTIFEVEPNVILYQSDLEVWRVGLNSH